MSAPEREVMDQLQAFQDHKAISDKLGIWCRCADTRDMEPMSDVFAEDVEWDFGGGTVDHGLSAVINRITAHVGVATNCGQRHIHLANLRVDVTGDLAESEAYFFAASAGLGRYEGQALLQWGNYLDSWERRPQGWRIVKRNYSNRFEVGPMEIVYGSAPAEMWQEGDARRSDR
jgi:hypothetical protein